MNHPENHLHQWIPAVIRFAAPRAARGLRRHRTAAGRAANRIVNKAALGVMKIQVAVTDAEASTPGLRSVSMTVPHAHALANIAHLATDQFPSWVEPRPRSESRMPPSAKCWRWRSTGASAVETSRPAYTGLQWKWGDAQNVMDAWSEQMANRLKSWTSGAGKP